MDVESCRQFAGFHPATAGALAVSCLQPPETKRPKCEGRVSFERLPLAVATAADLVTGERTAKERRIFCIAAQVLVQSPSRVGTTLLTAFRESLDGYCALVTDDEAVAHTMT